MKDNGLHHGIAVVLWAAACTVANPNYRPSDRDAAPTADSPMAFCDPNKPFGTPTPVPGINSSRDEGSFATTRDGLTGFISVDISANPYDTRIEVAQRATRTSDFSAPQPGAAAAVNAGAGDERSPSPVSDGLLLYFWRQDPTLVSLFVATRLDSQSSYGNEAQISVGTTALQPVGHQKISSDAQTLYWSDWNDETLRAATRGQSPWSFVDPRTMSTMPIGLGGFALSTDELTLYYSPGNGADMFVTSRPNTSTPFAPGPRLDALNSTQNETPVFISFDGCTLYFASNRSGGLGGYDIWQARRPL